MNEYYYTYTKLRQEFGRPVSFTTTEPKTLGSVAPDPSVMERLVRQNPRTFYASTMIELSEHTVGATN